MWLTKISQLCSRVESKFQKESNYTGTSNCIAESRSSQRNLTRFNTRYYTYANRGTVESRETHGGSPTRGKVMRLTWCRVYLEFQRDPLLNSGTSGCISPRAKGDVYGRGFPSCDLVSISMKYTGAE